MRNKGRREEIAKLKHKKRCKEMGIDPKQNYCFKAQGKPCSCYLCSHDKYSRKVKHKNKDTE